MKSLLKKFLPKSIKNLWHLGAAFWGALRYGFPSRRIIVIGITGTSGKSTSVYLLRQVLEYAGYRVGSLSTIDFYINGKEKLNNQKMTMLGKAQIQKYLRQMVNEKCDIAIVETTSEGIVQHRHKFINYDIVALTNLYPEHIESHGSFENYKNAKKELFSYVAKLRRKKIQGRLIEKIAIVNRDIKEASEFIDFSFDYKYSFGFGSVNNDEEKNITVSDIKSDNQGLYFNLNGQETFAPMFGEHNALNCALSAAVAKTFDIDWKTIILSIGELHNAPGRNEFISEADQYGFQVIVDYAFEPVALKALYNVVDLIAPKNVIHVCGAAGGGRDKARRFPVGLMVGKRANYVIITDEDPYDENPKDIMDEVASGARTAGKVDDENLFIIEDRYLAIQKGLSLAKPGDLVLITGKGSEQAICGKNGLKTPWDDRVKVRQALSKLQ